MQQHAAIARGQHLQLDAARNIGGEKIVVLTSTVQGSCLAYGLDVALHVLINAAGGRHAEPLLAPLLLLSSPPESRESDAVFLPKPPEAVLVLSKAN